jgi:hypothetical protein
MLEAIPGMAVDQREKQPAFRYGVTELSFVSFSGFWDTNIPGIYNTEQ